MIAVLFEVRPKTEGKAENLDTAKKLKLFLEKQEGLISIREVSKLSR